LERNRSARELGHRLAVGVALGNAFPLALIKHSLAPELGALGFGTVDAVLASLAYQAALELRDAAHGRQHQTTDVGRRVAPALTEADEPASALLQLSDNDGILFCSYSRIDQKTNSRKLR